MLTLKARESTIKAIASSLLGRVHCITLMLWWSHVAPFPLKTVLQSRDMT